MKEYYCNCQADCIRKGKLKKILKIEFSGKRTIKQKVKVQICTNIKNDCTCPYRVTIDRAFGF